MTSHSVQSRLRIGLDLGGSKIEGILLSPEATEMARYRIATPRDDYAATIVAIFDLTCRLMQDMHATKADAESDKEHFDGKTTE